jgi:tRNA nucleotidyltransferase (CCA-adding enzyme)
MTTNEYLQQVLQDQNLADNSTELEALQGHRKDVEVLLRSAFPQSSPTIRYGGSRAKGTLIREAYDLDIICYFEPDDTSAGDGLEDIYNNVKKALEASYMVTDKTSALRLKSKARETMGVDFHIDVVPGISIVAAPLADLKINGAGSLSFSFCRLFGGAPAGRQKRMKESRANPRR